MGWCGSVPSGPKPDLRASVVFNFHDYCCDKDSDIAISCGRWKEGEEGEMAKVEWETQQEVERGQGACMFTAIDLDPVLSLCSSSIHSA